MTQLISPTYDVLGIGFGPSNLALAIALQEQALQQGRNYQALFLDKQHDYRWHGNTLVTQSELQISYLKDLVTLRNPTSPFSFVNYLHKHDRLIDFINLGTLYPCRMEYNDYLCWVARQFSEQCAYGEEVSRVEPVQGPDGIELLKVLSTDVRGQERFRLTRSVVVSTGGTPRIPAAFSHLRNDARVFHHSRYLESIAKQPCLKSPSMRIAVIGGGQSAAEAFIDLNDSYPSAQVDMILRAAVLKPADDSPFVNEIFAPSYTDLVFNEPQAEREKLIREYHNTNYSVVDLNLIESIYSIFYRQKVANQQRHAFLSRRTVELAGADSNGIELTLRDSATGATEQRRYDVVILATGYQRSSHRELLAPLKDYLGDYEVGRDYRLQTDPRLRAGIYMQGFSQDSHGLSDTLLSVLPMRAAEIAASIFDQPQGGKSINRDTTSRAAQSA
ncbi:lysine N(6)-hydroxylase/L-ornithine N(5)-oxygenase family protein [Pseudomonas syringae group sp. J309-1]|uniref:lysine N(6)-hydroxylase/L-ornithine N(5)-oxygenase family protein n=1 Tax=Pseudomonas syringae group sp. J309-1 TaxID=3079588 RepID=UPI0029114613|nr:SidA/IucD/PvdA family monooxygenase [Pseudomonas syringae group sp. J309-1]MDU8361021.1 SidA/IucD/PvdA family monooxygenase [Pseudomonas syringae group sp. J309-1]